MTKGDIVNHLSKNLGVTKKAAGDFLNAFVTLAYKQAKTGFTIPGLGKLYVATRKKRKGRNPATGETIVIPSKKVVKFKVSKTAQDAVYPPKK